ncbi:hypothetical protein YC2023_120025 [Brassica napus]
MKTVRADEFTSRHSEDSIRSMAARSDEQMSFFLSTIDQIDEGTRIHASVGEQLIKKFDDKLREGDAIVVQLFKVLPDDSLALTNNDSSQWSVGTATSIRARFFVLNEMLTIREIIDSTLVGTFVTLGTIETIDTERGIVRDDSGEANFLLFDANAQQIVRHSAAELYDENEDEDFLPEAVSDLFGKRVLCEISVDAGNIKGKSSQYVVRLATDDREMVEEFADLPPKPVLMLESTDDISSGSGGFTATPLSKRKSEQDEDSCLEDQHSVNKKLSQKKFKGE